VLESFNPEPAATARFDPIEGLAGGSALTSAAFGRNQIRMATKKFELCPRMAWQ